MFLGFVVRIPPAEEHPTERRIRWTGASADFSGGQSHRNTPTVGVQQAVDRPILE